MFYCKYPKLGTNRSSYISSYHNFFFLYYISSISSIISIDYQYLIISSDFVFKAKVYRLCN